MFVNAQQRAHDKYIDCTVRAASIAFIVCVASVHHLFVCPYDRLDVNIRQRA